MKKVLLTLAFALFACASIASAQPRPADTTASPTVYRTAPSTVETKYEGGLFGFSKKMEGTLKFDDANQRIVFFDKKGKEMFGIPYESMLVISPNQTKVQSNTGKVIGAVPIMGAGLGGSLLKKKKSYLLIQFRDQDVNAQGTATFKLDSTEMLGSVIQTLGQKAEMKPRGDAYYRPTPPRKVDF